MKALFFLACCLALTAARAQAPFPPPGPLYADARVQRVDLLVDTADLTDLYATLENEDHYPVTAIFDHGDTPDTLRDVGLRLRGNTSLYAAKKSFKLSFNTFVPGRKYRGVEKVNLNGEHNDPSVVRAKLCWDLMREMRVPASRANHVALYINGAYWGVYANVEHVDDEFVQRRFGDSVGNLYKCLYPADLAYRGPDGDDYKMGGDERRVYQLKTNRDADDYGGLARFIDVLNNTPRADFACELERVFDVQAYLRAAAVEVLVGHWDGPIYNQNNFYLYDDPQTGRFRYIPYDLDNTLGIRWFGEWTARDVYRWSPDGEPRPIYDRLMAEPRYRAQYTAYLRELLDEHFGEDTFSADVDAYRELIAPYIPADPFYPRDYGFDESAYRASFTEALDVRHVPHGLLEYVRLRAASARAQLEDTHTPPVISAASAPPVSAQQEVAIYADVADADAVEVSAVYYLNGQLGEARLYDDGRHGDGAAGDGRYGGTVPAIGAGAVLDYYVEAVDEGGGETRFPTCNTLRLRFRENPQRLYVNELQADNETTVADEDGDYDDWIELYNGGDAPIDLSDYALSDDGDEPGKWRLPARTLAPGGFVLVWADGDDRVDGGDLHASFRLDGGGEAVVLSTVSGDIVDEVSFGAQADDAAVGRLPDGRGLTRDVSPTPGRANEAVSATAKPMRHALTVSPNPTSGRLRVAYPTAVATVTVLDALGRRLVTRHPRANTFALDVSDLPPATYVLVVRAADGNRAARRFVRR